jgi:hypothetical protein
LQRVTISFPEPQNAFTPHNASGYLTSLRKPF